jgi:integrase
VLQTIRRLLIRPGCFRLERELPGGICTHDVSAPWQGTQWNEIDLGSETCTIPAERMKAGKAHRVPLSKPAQAILRDMLAARQSGDPSLFVFPGLKANTPLSNMAMAKLLGRMKRSDLTVHGFRSTFRDWAAERTNFPREVCEHALAHSLPDKVEAAYRRSDLFDKRRSLMDEWGRFSKDPSEASKAVSIHADET